MDRGGLKEDWNEVKRKLKLQYETLSDNDLLFSKGKEEEMIARLEIKLGKSKEDLNKIISSFKINFKTNL